MSASPRKHKRNFPAWIAFFVFLAVYAGAHLTLDRYRSWMSHFNPYSNQILTSSLLGRGQEADHGLEVVDQKWYKLLVGLYGSPESAVYQKIKQSGRTTLNAPEWDSDFSGVSEGQPGIRVSERGTRDFVDLDANYVVSLQFKVGRLVYLSSRPYVSSRIQTLFEPEAKVEDGILCLCAVFYIFEWLVLLRKPDRRWMVFQAAIATSILIWVVEGLKEYGHDEFGGHIVMHVGSGLIPVVTIGIGYFLSESIRKKRVGLYPICLYDLRATPDRCPECGTEVPKGHLVSQSGADPTAIKS